MSLCKEVITCSWARWKGSLIIPGLKLQENLARIFLLMSENEQTEKCQLRKQIRANKGLGFSPSMEILCLPGETKGVSKWLRPLKGSSKVKALLTSPKINPQEKPESTRIWIQMMILPTYVELVWGCSNASFGILRPGFRFLPMGKDIRKTLRIKS